ncbi:unnamed protein product [Candidula unifasciata]|uniref:Uncharacterized protein n=1 Tax=Candidula unifasciata TaxID=100452 RepID=A0A8S3YFL1_9EUPU|nr:unnamed protein product [Candidula unifasciata]
MTGPITAVEDQVTQLALYLMKVDMFPVFFIAHFCLSCLLVREDSKDVGIKFRQNHPFASWLCSVVTALSGLFVLNFLFGKPLIEAAKESTLVTVITVIWYLLNYSPSDVVYKIVTFTPVLLSASVLQECLRVRFIYLGIQTAAQEYPGHFLVILLAGVINGNGYGLIKVAERLIRGKWTPDTNELLDVTYFTKSGLYASLLFILHQNKIIPVPIELLYLGIIVAFVTLRLLITVGNIEDPLLPLESPLTSWLFRPAPEETRVEVNQAHKQK